MASLPRFLRKPTLDLRDDDVDIHISDLPVDPLPSAPRPAVNPFDQPTDPVRKAVLARVAHCGRVGLDFEQEIRRDTDGRRCTSALVSVACVRVGDWRPARIPAELLERIGQ